jgi:heme O synthase-like polyprenyltransferase
MVMVNLVKAVWLAIGGLLVTFAANALNQVLEKDFDI